MCLDVKKRSRETGVNDSFYFHGDEDGPQEDNLKRPDIGQPEYMLEDMRGHVRTLRTLRTREDNHPVVLPRSYTQLFQFATPNVLCKQQRGNCI